MAHEIWEDNMVFAGEMPWHGIGKQVEPSITGMELKSLLDLSPVERKTLYADPGDGSALIKVDSHVATMRVKDRLVVGVVGPDFTPTQDADLIDMMEALRGEGLCAFETAGILRNGSRFFLMLRIPNGTLKLKTPNGKTDVVVNYLCVSHAHDGSLANEFTPTSVRVVCANTLSAAQREAKRQRVSYYIKHTTNSEYRIKAAIAAYKKVIEFNVELAARYEALMAMPFDMNQMKTLGEKLFPVPAGKEDNIPAGVLKSRYEVSRLMLEGKGHIELGIAGTGWGAYNAVTEYLDWSRPTRGDKDLNENEKKAKMWEASQFGNQVVDKKLEALELIEQIGSAN